MPAPVQCRSIYLLSRNESKFIALADRITDVAQKALSQDIIPSLLSQFPWIYSYLSIAGKRD